MIFRSVCSGIEAASVAWQPLGWRADAFSEIEAFPSAVLAHHHAQVPNLGDMTRFQEWPDATFDVLVGGTPCQSFSLAGLRAGIADPRGNLMLTYLAIADRYRPDWLVWENVPGVLSSGGGRDFAAFLGGLGALGYGWAYRVLDAQYFGLAQRRGRVFVVASARGWASAGAVLFERESLRGDPAPRRGQGQNTAGSLVARAGRNGGASNAGLDAGHLLAFGGNDTRGPIEVATACRAHGSFHNDFESETFVARALKSSDGGIDREDGHTLIAFSSVDHGADAGAVSPPLRAMGHHRSHANAGGQVAVLAFDTTQVTSPTNRSNPKPGDPCHPLAAGAHAPAVAFQTRIGRNGRGQPSEVVPALNGADAGETSDMRPCVAQGMQVRRLTPRECERLQGFPDDYTLIPYRGKPAKDGPRYKALGNSMAVPVMRWIGRRIELVEKLRQEAA